MRVSLTSQISIGYFKHDWFSPLFETDWIWTGYYIFKGKKSDVSIYLYNNSSTGSPLSLIGIPSYWYIFGSCINQLWGKHQSGCKVSGALHYSHFKSEDLNWTLAFQGEVRERLLPQGIPFSEARSQDALRHLDRCFPSSLQLPGIRPGLIRSDILVVSGSLRCYFDPPEMTFSHQKCHECVIIWILSHTMSVGWGWNCTLKSGLF